ncbi:MAG: MurR/RpiR family transcriptional regulator [Erysipelotrichaceae bacterium]|nr:MurR/RpiR family transcriptional regulator [Erysipelotrichaceae bacterium]
MKNNINEFGLVNSLTDIINNEEEDSTNVVLAKYVLNRINSLKELNIFDMAEECFVTRASVRRFCQNLGFENFREMKNCSQQHYSFYKQSPYVENYEEYLVDLIQEMLTDCTKCYNNEEYKLAALMKEAGNVIFLISDIYSSRCIEFQRLMIMNGKMVRVIRHGFSGNKLLTNLSDNDLVVVVSVSGGFALEIKDVIEENPCKKALITTIDDKKILSLYDYIFKVSRKPVLPYKSIFHTYAIEYYLDLVYNDYSNLIRK